MTKRDIAARKEWLLERKSELEGLLFSGSLAIGLDRKTIMYRSVDEIVKTLTVIEERIAQISLADMDSSDNDN